MIHIYTDGSCLGNPGPGGWAAVIEEKDGKKTLAGREDKTTTNQRMEVLAAIKGLEAVPEGVDVTVHSDSQYLVNTMTREWKRNANKDLWTRLDKAVSRRKVTWKWVKAHAGNPGNELANELANQMAGSERGSEAHDAVSGESLSLSHLDASGKARMVDVGGKPDTEREAIAKGSVKMSPETLDLIKRGGFEKGDVLGTARVAGIMGAKNTSQLIPLCHPIPLSQVTVDFELDEGASAVNITAAARATAKTGVEMEALVAVSSAALTIYDMCKSADRAMRIEAVRLVRKTGGRSGDIVLEET